MYSNKKTAADFSTAAKNYKIINFCILFFKNFVS